MTKDNQEIIKAIKQENQKLEKDFELHTKALAEDFEKKVEIVGEGWKGVQEKVDTTFDLVGEMKQDIEIMKADIAFIKGGLKQKVDIDEFQALEKRVILLERKLKSA